MGQLGIVEAIEMAVSRRTAALKEVREIERQLAHIGVTLKDSLQGTTWALSSLQEDEIKRAREYHLASVEEMKRLSPK